MNKEKDYYKILGIDTSADIKQIKSAYRSLARKYHPDMNLGNRLCEEKFKEVGEAYSILGDRVKKGKYDILRGLIEKTLDTREQTKKQASRAYSEKKKSVDEKGSFGGMFSGFVDKVFEKEKKEEKKAEPQKGSDITADISLTIVEAHNGTIRTVNILHTESCRKCKGKKYFNTAPCFSCKGDGEISTRKKISVKIPPNVKAGSKIRITGEGNRGQNGGTNGDLFLVVNIIKNSFFEFDNLNVICEMPITPTEAALGAEILIPTIDGEITIRIPPETHSGQKFRLAAQGIPDANTAKRGDQVVTVRIEMPGNLTQREKELYMELAKIRVFNPRENIVFNNN